MLSADKLLRARNSLRETRAATNGSLIAATGTGPIAVRSVRYYLSPTLQLTAGQGRTRAGNNSLIPKDLPLGSGPTSWVRPIKAAPVLLQRPRVRFVRIRGLFVAWQCPAFVALCLQTSHRCFDFRGALFRGNQTSLNSPSSRLACYQLIHGKMEFRPQTMTVN
jgi:hypothetical protein